MVQLSSLWFNSYSNALIFVSQLDVALKFSGLRYNRS